MADTITKIMDCYAASGFDPATKTTPAMEWLKVELDATGTTIVVVCNHGTAASIHTRLVKEALSFVMTPINAAAGATNVLMHGAISTTTYPNDTITLTGVVSGAYNLLIIGRA